MQIVDVAIFNLSEDYAVQITRLNAFDCGWSREMKYHGVFGKTVIIFNPVIL